MVEELFSREDVLERRETEEASMPSRCTIKEEVPNRSPGGFTAPTWTDVATDVPCRLSAGVAGSEMIEAGQVQTLGRWTLSLPADTPIKKGHQVVVTGTSAEGVNWAQNVSVIAPLAPKTYEVRRKVICADQTSSGR